MLKKTIDATLILITAMTGCVALGGCSNGKLDLKFGRPTAEESLLVALKSDDPDLRYAALSDLAESKDLREDWSVRAIVVIVRTDPNNLVRSLAVHCLGLIADARVVEHAIAAMDDQDGQVRSEAAWTLSQTPYEAFERSQLIQRGTAVLINALSRDTCLDVRIYSATALDKFKDPNVLPALISALRDADFAVRYHAEHSLIRLTGKTFNGSAARWLEWLKSTDEPFKDAGETPVELAHSKRGIWQRTKDQVHQWYINWQGPSKK